MFQIRKLSGRVDGTDQYVKGDIKRAIKQKMSPNRKLKKPIEILLPEIHGDRINEVGLILSECSVQNARQLSGQEFCETKGRKAKVQRSKSIAEVSTKSLDKRMSLSSPRLPLYRSQPMAFAAGHSAESEVAVAVHQTLMETDSFESNSRLQFMRRF